MRGHSTRGNLTRAVSPIEITRTFHRVAVSQVETLHRSTAAGHSAALIRAVPPGWMPSVVAPASVEVVSAVAAVDLEAAAVVAVSEEVAADVDVRSATPIRDDWLCNGG